MYITATTHPILVGAKFCVKEHYVAMTQLPCLLTLLCCHDTQQKGVGLNKASICMGLCVIGLLFLEQEKLHIDTKR